MLIKPAGYSHNIAFTGRKDWTENEKQFFEFKKQFTRREHLATIDEQKLDWNFNTNAPRNAAIEESESVLDLYSDKKALKKFQEFKRKGVTDPKLKETLDRIFMDFKKIHKNKADRKKLSSMEDPIERKVDGYRGKINGKSYNEDELLRQLGIEMEPKQRKKIYRAVYTSNGNKIAPDIIKLVKARNKFARKNGYKDYFSYSLKEDFETDEKALFKLMSELDKKTSKLYASMRAKENEMIAKTFGIKVNDIMPWHYGIIPKGNSIIEVNKHIKNRKAIPETVFAMFKKMGWNIHKLPITLDLFPRANKSQENSCLKIDDKDIRIYTNIIRNYESIKLLSHELGHGVHYVGISKKLPFEQKELHCALTEAIAMVMESLPYNETYVSKKLGIPAKAKETLKLQRMIQDIESVRNTLFLINFEKQMYTNPNQNLAELWYKLNKKYLFREIPPKLDNKWASFTHLISSPGYYQNYLRAHVMVPQIYEAAKAKLGKLTENPKTAEFFRSKLFRLGKSMSEADLIKKFTGKPLSTDAFVKEMEELAKHL